MTTNYNTLSSIDKANITRLINAKKALDKAKRMYDKEVEKSFNTIKNNGSIKKEYATISYIPSSDYISLDTTRIKVEEPQLYEKYGKTIHRNDSVKVVL